MKYIKFVARYLELMPIILNNVSKFEYIKNVQIKWKGETRQLDKITKIPDCLFPESMKRAQKIKIYSSYPEHHKYLKENYQKIVKKLSYSLDIQ